MVVMSWSDPEASSQMGARKKEAERKDSRATAVRGKTGQGDEGGLMLAGHPHARTAEDVGTYEKKRFRRMV